jgi:hypothetical protein
MFAIRFVVVLAALPAALGLPALVDVGEVALRAS